MSKTKDSSVQNEDNSKDASGNFSQPTSQNHQKQQHPAQNQGSSRRNRGKGKQHKNQQKKTDDSNNISGNYDFSSSRSFTALNLSTRVICAKQNNFSVITDTISAAKYSVIDLPLTIRPLEDELIAMADVWARKIVSDQNINLKKIINARSSMWEPTLRKAYVYDYFRNLLYGISEKRISEFPKGQVSLVGHSIMFEVLNKLSYIFEYDDITVRYCINISKSDYDYIFKLARSFNFIRDCMSPEDSSRFFLENVSLDRVLNGLNSECSAHGPHFYRHLNSNVNSNVTKYLTKDCFPVGNSVYSSENSRDKWFCCTIPDHDITTHSVMFGKALFFTSLDDKIFNRYYDYVDRSDDFVLTKYHVSSVCGWTYPNYIDRFNSSEEIFGTDPK